MKSKQTSVFNLLKRRLSIKHNPEQGIKRAATPSAMSSNEPENQSPAVERMEQIIKQQARVSTEDGSCHEQVWSAELTEDELEEARRAAHSVRQRTTEEHNEELNERSREGRGKAQ